jgi:phage shock protein E
MRSAIKQITMKFLQNLFGDKQSGIRQLLNEGAIVIDVRTPLEYNAGHVRGSKNIPLDQLKERVDEIRAFNKPLITVCQSGMRSGTARSFLQSRGFEVVNGYSWQALNKIV